MKTFTLSLFLSLLSLCSFAEDATAPAWFTVTINGEPLIAPQHEAQAMLITQSGSMDGRMPKRTVLSNTLQGKPYTINNTEVTDNISLEMVYNGPNTSSCKDYNVFMQYRETNYYMLRDSCQFNVLYFSWQPEKQCFIISLQFDCVMRSWGYPMDEKQDIHISGQITNLQVSVPSWLAKK
ncbi:MAG: hypothetical protein U0V74_15235 [Chitinophagales bacterium]